MPFSNGHLNNDDYNEQPLDDYMKVLEFMLGDIEENKLWNFGLRKGINTILKKKEAQEYVRKVWLMPVEDY